MDDNTPVIIGVGQYSERVGEEAYRALSPMDLAGEAARAAIADCQAVGSERGTVAGAIDTVAAIRQFEISRPGARAPFGSSSNPPRSIAQRVGADPQRAILEIVGGQGPQKLVGELAAQIAAGESSCCMIAGSEAISTMLTLLKDGRQADWSEAPEGQLEDRGFGVAGLAEKTATANGLGSPLPAYALFENARRARLGLPREAYRAAMAELFAPFTRVAAANPHAAARAIRSAEDLAQITPRNRIVADPFPRMMVARDQVNQAAAIILCSVGKARELGVPSDRWVHIHSVTSAAEAPLLARPDLGRSPASIAAVQRALELAGVAIGDVALMDFYSCFPIAVFNQIDALGIAPDDPRGLTLTGGLPFFGGAGNNYSAHAIAEAVGQLRRNRKAYALIGANGGYMSKYSAAIYSCRQADWSQSRWQELPGQTRLVDVLGAYSGEAIVETYTIQPGKQGAAASIVARTPGGSRLAATIDPSDDETLAAMHTADPLGRTINVRQADAMRNFFEFRN